MKLTAIQKNKIKKYFRKRPEVVAVYLYGSQVSGRAGQLSDVDLGVLLLDKVSKNRAFELQLKYIGVVEKILQSDLKADVKILREDQALNYLNFVVNEGELLVCNNNINQDEFRFKVSQQYLDFYPVLDDYYQQMNQRIEEGIYAS